METAEPPDRLGEGRFDIGTLADIAVDEMGIATRIRRARPRRLCRRFAGPTSISAMTTLAPSSAKRSAVARPMPPPPPVMNATFPASRAMIPPGKRMMILSAHRFAQGNL
jgi:hypothetical protein